MSDLMQKLQQLFSPQMEDPFPPIQMQLQRPPGLPFYPSRRYIEKKQAPEMTLTAEDVAAIGKAQRRAEDTGVLSPDIAQYLLPIAMVEGWGSGMGVRGKDDNAFYASKRFQSIMEKMGLEEGKDVKPLMIRGEKHYVPRPGGENGPAIAAALLAEKAAIGQRKGLTRPEDIVRLYNGKGHSIERMYSGDVPADVDVYWSKVREASEALKHPANEPFTKHYRQSYGPVETPQVKLRLMADKLRRR